MLLVVVWYGTIVRFCLFVLLVVVELLMSWFAVCCCLGIVN